MQPINPTEVLDIHHRLNPTVAGGMQLSGGRMQQIGLAWALYSDPVILILDEPHSNLNNARTTALNRAIRQMKAAQKSILIMGTDRLRSKNVTFFGAGWQQTNHFWPP